MRLIDADVLIENAFEVHTKEFGTVWVVGVDAINEQPIAYDMEKVVAELEKEKGNVFIDGKKMYQEDYFIDIDKAIDIVKAGGVE